MGAKHPYQTLDDQDDLDDVLAPGSGAAAIFVGSLLVEPGREPPAQGAAAVPFSALATEFKDSSVRFFAIEPVASPELVEALQVRTLPTVLLCLDGAIIDAIVGRFEVERVAKRIRWLTERTPSPLGLFARLFGARRVGGWVT